MLANNIASLRAQTNQNFEQVCLLDEVGYGIGESYRRMAALGDRIKGNFVFILDDDDMLIRPTFVADLQDIAVAENPDVIMLRMDHGPLGILPNKHWGKRPHQGDIGCSAYVVRREIWQAHAHAMQSGHYASDFDFISSIFDADLNIYWFDVVASRVQKISHGAPEAGQREQVTP